MPALSLGLGLSAMRRRAFNPATLFAASEQGAWLDPSDLTSMFQDSAGTTPCAVDAVVGKILDKSGRGNHFTQATTANKPILRLASGRYYLEFDGTDDFMASAAINLTGTSKVTVWAGIRKSSNAATASVVGSFTNAAAGEFELLAPRTTSGDYGGTMRAASGNSQVSTPTYAAPELAVLTAQYDIAGATATDEVRVRRNGALPTQTASIVGPAGTGNFNNSVVYLGRRGGSTFPFNGRLYGLIIRAVASTAAEVAGGESYMNAKAVAY